MSDKEQTPPAATCDSCDAQIVWAEIDGKRIPLNKRRVRSYHWWQNIEGDHDFFEARDLVHISHFITCPQASKWGKRKT